MAKQINSQVFWERSKQTTLYEGDLYGAHAKTYFAAGKRSKQVKTEICEYLQQMRKNAVCDAFILKI